MGANAPCAAKQADGNLEAVSHGQHVLTHTAAAAWRIRRLQRWA